MTSAAPDDEKALAAHANALTEAVARCVPEWIERSVRLRAGFDVAASPPVASAIVTAQQEAQLHEVAQIAEVLATDIDQQRMAPMALLRQAVRHPTGVLVLADTPQPRRDEFSQSQFPDDLYDLSPATWADVHPELHEPGLAWGAAKAFVHLARRKSEGLR